MSLAEQVQLLMPRLRNALKSLRSAQEFELQRIFREMRTALPRIEKEVQDVRQCLTQRLPDLSSFNVPVDSRSS